MQKSLRKLMRSLKKLQKTTPKNNGKPCKYATHNVVMFPIFANSQFLEQFHNTDFYNLVLLGPRSKIEYLPQHQTHGCTAKSLEDSNLCLKRAETQGNLGFDLICWALVCMCIYIYIHIIFVHMTNIVVAYVSSNIYIYILLVKCYK